jgi:hypothetical protein
MFHLNKSYKNNVSQSNTSITINCMHVPTYVIKEGLILHLLFNYMCQMRVLFL